MKVQLKDKSSNLPNCWKQCGVSKEEWDKLQEGKEIDVKTMVVGIEHLVQGTASSKSKKGDK